ncbi:long-chain fatty acid--CoA ligase [Gottfriedia acidiceleris]|uniref:long-chain fatty acid--CoA ligase n=1 Tax=Gottfriedia acidiceleris TaxID=371036 RepID=UPI000B436772|nr:long-chain fatty acid--CoA ligase [Gottfriedia acidiceleris]
MSTSHFAYWPKRVSKSLTVPETTLYDNLVVSAKRYPNKTAIEYYGASKTYKQLLEEVDHLAGYLEHRLEVYPGERVMLYMQNSPQYVIAFYAILRVRGIVVPINPMNTTDELEFYINDCEIKTAFIGQELSPQIEPLQAKTGLENLVVAVYSEYLPAIPLVSDLSTEITQPKKIYESENIFYWEDAIQTQLTPSLYEGNCEDVAVLPYTSGTTGLPKGCIHTHKTVQANVVGSAVWMNISANAVSFSTLPLFHVTGMVHGMHTPIFTGSSMVLLTRWNRNHACKLIENYQCTHWVNISTMLIDFLANPSLNTDDIKSLVNIAGGGAPLPEAVGEHLFQLTGLKFVEGYGLSETIAQTHFNPPDRPKLQCLGIPSFDVDARIIEPITMKQLGVGEVGEIVVNGPQVFKGYFNRPEETKDALIEIDGKLFFRTGDIGRFDDEGYYFIVDRVKRMINASGFKVWPTEVENLLYKHPAIQQACVVSKPDEKRGETVKAYVILNPVYLGKVSEDDIIDWSKEHMASYKYPRYVEFTKKLPTTASGKILWRTLQEAEWSKVEQVSESE